ncbi:hypothetical protein TCDM_10285 [Trypanosoma cruzi Dm28c]|uniref:Mucin-associated surface protein (MASP) n=1 Tax=Trypanosoma cruzi Dm28c TaxID=1416333 RepID=V5BCI7_TRYCR|nr:hypothetical protein TCDM_10285 [Trypanosoma cruzi Dm28c]
MKDAPPPIHGNNSVAAACPFPLLLLLAAAAAVPTLSSGCKREAYINWHVPFSIYIHSACLYTLYQGHAVCTLPLLSVADVAAPRVFLMGLGITICLTSSEGYCGVFVRVCEGSVWF